MRVRSRILLYIQSFLLVIILIIFLMYLNNPGLFSRFNTSEKSLRIAKETSLPWDDPGLDNLPARQEGEFIRYGHELITHTSRYIGPEVKDPKMRFAGNNLACQNCHLDAGTRKFSAPYIGVYVRFPQFRGRENTIGTIQERINGCMQRSMNGKPLPENSREMKAMVSYMRWVSRGVAVGQNIKEIGYTKLEIPERKADLDHGELVFQQNCVPCHGEDGQGVRNGEPGDAKGYLYPPLWGPDSFNNGAGMHRILTAARFIKGNMPFGTTANDPLLSDEEAYDVAAYINSHSRPEKTDLDNDYPDLSKKPADCPYPPYADHFPLKQHKYGPFQPITKYYSKK